MFSYWVAKVSPYLQSRLLLQPLECLHTTGSSLLLGLIGSLVGLSSRARLPEPKLWLGTHPLSSQPLHLCVSVSPLQSGE